MADKCIANEKFIFFSLPILSEMALLVKVTKKGESSWPGSTRLS